MEIYRQEDIGTNNDWTFQSFDFLNEDEFIIEDPATFRFELLPYCLVGNGATVAAWDIDEIKVTASCAPFEGLNQIISGNVKTPAGDPFSNVEIKLTASLPNFHFRTTTPDENGYYLYEEVLEGNECQLSASNHGEYRNGVSTLDLILIQKHLLGLKTFDTPYKYIAADANRSNSISVKDILDLRKLILGIQNTLPNNTSWRFGYADEINGGYPWGFKETIDIEFLKYDYNNADFTAVKVGDLNGDVELNATGNPVVVRHANIFSLNVHDEFVSRGVPVWVDFYTDDFAHLSGIQFALDMEGHDVIGVRGGQLQLNEENYRINENEFSLSWSDHMPLSLNAREKLFSLEIVPSRNALLSDLLTISDDNLNPEAYVGEDLAKNSISIHTINHREANENKLYQNEPNPFNERTTIRFQLEKKGVAIIRITDVSGRILKEINREFEQGMHSMEIGRSESSISQGILICQLECDGFTETVKMIKL